MTQYIHWNDATLDWQRGEYRLTLPLWEQLDDYEAHYVNELLEQTLRQYLGEQHPRPIAVAAGAFDIVLYDDEIFYFEVTDIRNAIENALDRAVQAAQQRRASLKVPGDQWITRLKSFGSADAPSSAS